MLKSHGRPGMPNVDGHISERGVFAKPPRQDLPPAKYAITNLTTQPRLKGQISPQDVPTPKPCVTDCQAVHRPGPVLLILAENRFYQGETTRSSPALPPQRTNHRTSPTHPITSSFTIPQLPLTIPPTLPPDKQSHHSNSNAHSPVTQPRQSLHPSK